jgi:hypothetical protein
MVMRCVGIHHVQMESESEQLEQGVAKRVQKFKVLCLLHLRSLSSLVRIYEYAWFSSTGVSQDRVKNFEFHVQR